MPVKWSLLHQPDRINLCFGSTQPNTNQTFVCTDGLVCTDQPVICFQRGENPASCGDTDSCGQCAPNYTFACTSRSTFAFCFGAITPTNVTGSCPDGYFCDASTQEICVTKATDDSIICHLN
uniref:MIP24315p n=1 Tax=Drosophila melanogaster TaxID=7227 RepID=D9PTT5_DROME|nr:MIP24315p [Drosophila melanogaster]